jgi:hypothetical protein
MLVLGGIVCLMIGSFSLLPVLAVFASAFCWSFPVRSTRVWRSDSMYRAHSSTTSAGFAPPSRVFLLGRGEPVCAKFAFSPDWWIYSAARSELFRCFSPTSWWSKFPRCIFRF